MDSNSIDDARPFETPSASGDDGQEANGPRERAPAMGDTEAELMATRKLLPMRYVAKEDDDGRYLTCVEAPNIRVRVQRDLSVSAAAARKYPEGSIFLDGVAQGEPFMDVQRQVYNLDHHEGCVRPFTLATCEQAMVVILKGLDLRGREWTVYGNEPDLDTVLAIWLILNHMRISGEKSEIRSRLMPLVRLEGVIDAHGFELQELAGLPEEVMQENLATIDRLRSQEMSLKQEGGWAEADPVEYTAVTLREIDELVYSARHFDGMPLIEELARVAVGADRVAVACRSDVGVYEVEKHLRKLHGDRIGLLILQKDPATYTLRLVDPFLTHDLEPVYERLNLLDPGVDGSNRWGGSADIGGSPRGGGTGLAAEEIARICQWVFQRPAVPRRLGVVAAVAGFGVLVVVGAVLAAAGGLPAAPPPGLLSAQGGVAAGIFAVVLAAVGGALLLVAAPSGGSAQYGLRRPTGRGWLALLPAAVILALAGGSWLPAEGTGFTGWMYLGAVVAGAVGCEVLFRGVVHGKLEAHFHIQRPGGPFFVSVPTVVAAVLSAVATPILFGPPQRVVAAVGTTPAMVILFTAALLLGLLCGTARERWGSLLPAVALHGVAAASAWVLTRLVAAP